MSGGSDRRYRREEGPPGAPGAQPNQHRQGSAGLPLVLELVRGPGGLPADEQSQEKLKEKLHLLQAESSDVDDVLTELSTHIVSISSREKTIFVTFKSFQEIWKFTTYYTTGFLAHCLENLLLDQRVWLTSLEEDISIRVRIHEETLNLVYRSVLMQEGSLFASCSSSQMFDGSTSAGDLYLEQGDVAQFEPPFLGSGWTVLSLADGARGTAPRPALEPVVPFHQWFLKSCSESILVGDGKPACDFPLHFAAGVCVATVEYDAEGPDELSVAPGDRIVVVGLLVPCFDWFTGRKEATGGVGLVKTSSVEPSREMFDATDIFLEGEEWMFSSQQEDNVIEEAIDKLKQQSQNDSGHNYKLDITTDQNSENETSTSSTRADPHQTELMENVQEILAQVKPSSSYSAVSRNGTPGGSEDVSLPCFTVHPVVEGTTDAESFVPLFGFLDGGRYKVEFGLLYALGSEGLASSVFAGHADEDELIAFLGVARETARKRRLLWLQTRLCFLLGRLCAGKSKFSQARVYFEESLSVPREGFADLRLLASIYSNLSTIYLLQKNKEGFFGVAERLGALLLGIPDTMKSLEDDSVLRYVLKKAILSHNPRAEARACYLLAKHHWSRSEDRLVVPYLERLLVVWDEAQGLWSISPSHGYLTLGELYRKLQLPQLSVSSAKRASLQPSATLTDSLRSMMLVLSDATRPDGIAGQEPPILAQVAPYLYRAKRQAFSEVQEGGGALYHALSHHLTLCLCQLFYKHRMVRQAIRHMHALIDSTPPPEQPSISVLERNSAIIWLAWLHIDNNEPRVAVELLDSVLAPADGTSTQEGVVLNMRGVALRCVGDHRGAAKSYHAAAHICQECEDMPNWAVAQANLGLLCLKAGAKTLAQRYLTEAVQLFSKLGEESHGENFITVLLELGQLYMRQQQLDYGKGCLEWALLLAIRAKLPDRQLGAIGHLCHLYERESPDQAQCIVYRRHQIQLLRCAGRRGQEGSALEAISQLYLSLCTERAYRAALDYTKTSLAIFIDLGCREKEAYGWLTAGKIYQLLGQTELVDIYLQAAQDVALSTGDTSFILKLLEAAGDIFLNSLEDQDKAITFYRDRALPIATKSGVARTRLRLCNKLSEVMLRLRMYAEAVEFAQIAVDISVSLGERLNERVACHRLAALFVHLQQHELAEHYYLKTLSLCPSPLEFDEETLYYVRVYQTLGDILFHDLKVLMNRRFLVPDGSEIQTQKEKYAPKDPFDAAGYYHLALAAAMDLGNKRSQLHLCTRLATIYHNFLRDRERSLFFYQKARAFAAELNIKRINISPDQQLVGSQPHPERSGQ